MYLSCGTTQWCGCSSPLHLALALATALQLLEDGPSACTLFTSQMSSSPHAAQVTNVRQSGGAAETRTPAASSKVDLGLPWPTLKQYPPRWGCCANGSWMIKTLIYCSTNSQGLNPTDQEPTKVLIMAWEELPRRPSVASTEAIIQPGSCPPIKPGRPVPNIAV